MMIDQDLINRIKPMLDDDLQVDTELVCSLLDNYISLIEQNAELHKQGEKYKAQIKNIIHCDDMNTGYEPSLSLFDREIDISKELVGYGEE